MDWMTMSLEARNLAFNNVAQVGAEVAQARREERNAASRALRAGRPGHLDLPYGGAERTRWDLYPAADPAAPCLVHIHGGYWQRGSREEFACLAEGVLARGWSAALPGYTLAPEANLTRIAAELRAALDWLAAEAPGWARSQPIQTPPRTGACPSPSRPARFLHDRISSRHGRTRRPTTPPRPLHPRRHERTHPNLPPSLRSVSPPGATPGPPSGRLPQDRYRPVNAALDFAPPFMP
ncbi:MAG: alpha/beta hydrolase [Geminicoccaceae bacterium]